MRNVKKRRTLLNRRAVLAATVLALIAVPTLLVAWTIQNRRLGSKALAMAQAFERAGEPEKAIRHLSYYLQTSPDDRDALALQARLLAETTRDVNQFLYAASVNDHLLRLDPDAPDSQDTRRRLVELYVRYSDALKDNPNLMAMPDRQSKESRYPVAETIAKQLFGPGKTNIPKDYCLLALAKEGLAAPGNPGALEEAIGNYKKALEGDPGDTVAAARLAQVYLKRQNDPAKARAVLDDLLKAHDTAEVRSVRYKYFRLQKDAKQAALELKAATALAPGNVEYRMAAAEEALRRGDIAAAKAEAEAVPKEAQDDRRVQLMRGRIALAEQDPDKAIEDWQKSLLLTGGSDSGLTWQLAYTLLQTGDLRRARPLIARYRDIGGEGSEPLYRLLKAELDLRSGWPARAVYGLERIRNRLSDPMKVLLLVTLGRAYEDLWDNGKALEAYQEAIEIDPEAQEPRLAIVNLRLKQQKLEDARAEVERGLKAFPEAPSLLITKTGILLREQAQLPGDRRSWSEFVDTLKQASGQAPNSPNLAMIETDYLTLQGKAPEATRLLKATVDKYPKVPTVAIAYAGNLARSGQVDEALRVLEQASSPAGAGDRAAIRISRASLLLALGRGRTARAALVQDIDRLPIAERPQVWHALGQMEAKQGDLDRARDAFLEYARLLPDDLRPRLDLLDLAMSSGDEKMVRETVAELRRKGEEPGQDGERQGPRRKAGNDESNDIIWRICQAQEHLWTTRAAAPRPDGHLDPRLEDARKLLEGVLIDAPEMPVAHLLYGDLLARLDQPEEVEQAAAHYRRAWDRGADAALPRLVNVLTRLGKTEELAKLKQIASASRLAKLSTLASLKQGDANSAARFLTQPSTNEPETPGSQLWRALMLARIGKGEESETVLKAMAEQRPNDLETRLRLLRAQAARGEEQAVAASIARIRADFKAENPDLIEARCRWAINDTRAADDAFTAALQGAPKDPAVLRFAASYYEETGRRPKAEETLRLGLKSIPGDRSLARALALLLAADSNDGPSWERAWEVLGPVPREGEPVEDRVARGLVLSYVPDPSRKEEAIAHLEALIEDIPTDSPHAPLARDMLARLLIRGGRPARAAQVAAVSANSGDDPAAIALYAEALIRSRKWDEAQVQIDRLVGLGPKDRRAAQLRVHLIQAQAESGQAVAALEKALVDREKTPGFEAFEREVLTTLDQIGPTAADAVDRVARRIAERDAGSSWLLARIRARQGRFAETLALCRRVVDVGSLEDLLQAGEIALKLAVSKRMDPQVAADAQDVLKAAQAREPENIALMTFQAMIAHINRRYDEEIALYRGILKRQPGHAVALNNLAWSLSEGKKQPAEALPYIDDLIQRTGRSAQALDTRGVILSRLGRHDEARRDLDESNRLAASDQTIFHLAVACRAAGREDDYRKCLDAVRKSALKPEQLDATEVEAYEALIKP